MTPAPISASPAPQSDRGGDNIVSSEVYTRPAVVDVASRRFRPRDRADGALAALAHAAGLLGLTVAGWLAAPFISIPLLFLAGQRRSPYLAAHAGQAALYQLAVVVLQALYLLWLGAGFLSFGGELPGVPELRVFDTVVEPWQTAVQVLWGLSALLWPVFYLGTAALAALGAWRALPGGASGIPWSAGASGASRKGSRSPPDGPLDEAERQEEGQPAV